MLQWRNLEKNKKKEIKNKLLIKKTQLAKKKHKKAR